MGDQRSVSNVFIKLFCGALRVVLMHLVLLFKVHVNCHCCTWACVCLKCLHLCSAVGWLCVSLEWRDSSPLLKYRGFVNDSREYFGGRGIARLPSSSQLQRVHLRRRCVLRRRKDCTQAFLFTTSACTSEEEGKAFFLTKSASSSEEEEQVSSSQCGFVLRRRRRTGLLPHNVGEFMQLVLRFVLSMSASRGVPALRMRLCWGTTQAGSLVTATHLEENASGASWGEAVAVGPRFHSPRRRLLKGLSNQEFQVAGRCRQSREDEEKSSTTVITSLGTVAKSVTDTDASVAKFTKIRQKEHL